MLENFFLWGKSQISGLFLSRRNLTNANRRGTPLILALFFIRRNWFPAKWRDGPQNGRRGLKIRGVLGFNVMPFL